MPDSPRNSPVLAARDGATVTLTLNRPGRRNGVTVAMCIDLHARLREIAASDARVLLLRGTGEDFSVGADLKGALPDETDLAGQGFADLSEVYHAATLLHTMPQITIAAIDGGCAGAAMGWAMACDLRLATPEARFATGFVRVGVSGDMGLPWTLTRLVGAARARELMLLGDKVDGTAALAMGLVGQLVPRAELHAAAGAMADALCTRDPLALRLIKANLVSAETPDFAAYIEIESARHLHTTQGMHERLARG